MRIGFANGAVGRLVAGLGTALALATSAAAQTDETQAPEACQPGEVVLRFSHVVADRGHPKGDSATLLADAINTELDGRACMIVYPSSTLFTDDDVMPALLSQDVEFAAPSLSKLEPYSPRFRIFDLPFLFEDMDAVEWFQNSGPGARLRRSLEPDGFKVLAFWNVGMRQVSANRPLLWPTDADGLTFRIQSSDVLRQMFATVGAESVRMPFRDVAGALAAGDVDGQTNNFANILSAGLYENQDGVTEINNTLTAYILVTSVEFWQSLPADLRRDINRIVLRITHEHNQRARQATEDARIALVTLGVPVRTLTPEQRAAWVDALQPVWRSYGDDIGWDLIDAAQAANR